MRLTGAATFVAILLLSACGGSPGSGDADAESGGTYDATVTRTTYGIPHIKADDYGSLGYGYGYAFAEDNLCVILEDLLTIRGERARWFGRDGSYSIPAAGVTNNNVDSDFFWTLMATDAVVANLREKASSDIRDATTGFAAGINRYVRELRSGEHPGRHASCRDAGWMAEIGADDIYRRYFRLSVLASATALSNEIAAAEPPPAAPPCRTRCAARSRSAATCTPSAPRRRPAASRCCSAIRTSRGPVPNACTPCISRFPAASTSWAGPCTACRRC